VEPQQQGQPSSRAIAITPAGIVGTLVLAAAVIAFVRLGFWQLARLGERRELNAGVAARMHGPPVSDAGLLTDTAGLHYRRASLGGTFDNERSIVLAGRSHRGVPGVYLLTPLQLNDRPAAVLVNRGWVASPDAATIDFGRLQLADSGVADALVVPFPATRTSLAAPDSLPRPGGFRRVWFTIDGAALRAQFPYQLLPLMLQELPDTAIARPANVPARITPTRLAAPPLDEGSHLGYALQWFSFALIGIIGWAALVMRGRARTAATAAFAVLLLCPSDASAQLRPLAPIGWRVFDAGTYLVGEAGMGVLWELPAPLTGASGRLVEAGNYHVAVRSGRIAIELSGTALWHFTEMRRTSTAASGVRPAPDGARRDAGVATAATSFRASLPQWTTDLVLRFGVSIPTTSDESGLDRDRTDFFATVALRYPRGRLSLWMENGLGINGTTWPEYPQSDVWTFAFGTAYAMGMVRPTAALVGRQDGHSWIVRGNEDQRELRLGVDIGRERWVSVHYIRGLTEFSPEHGVRLTAGTALGARRSP
jgi:surfeit locus 1 family protein